MKFRSDLYKPVNINVIEVSEVGKAKDLSVAPLETCSILSWFHLDTIYFPSWHQVETKCDKVSRLHLSHMHLFSLNMSLHVWFEVLLRWVWRTPSSGMLCHVALVRTDILPKCRFLQEPHGVTSRKTAFLCSNMFQHGQACSQLFMLFQSFVVNAKIKVFIVHIKEIGEPRTTYACIKSSDIQSFGN
jgi:hypothetical protein